MAKEQSTSCYIDFWVMIMSLQIGCKSWLDTFIVEFGLQEEDLSSVQGYYQIALQSAPLKCTDPSCC